MATEQPFASVSRNEVRAVGEHLARQVEQAEDRARDRAYELRSQLHERAEERRSKLEQGVRRLTGAFRAAGEQLTPEEQTTRQLFDYATNRLERTANYLGEADLDRVRADAMRWSRQHPAVVVGGALMAGLAAGRLLRGMTASVPRTPELEPDWSPARAPSRAQNEPYQVDPYQEELP